MIRIVPRRAGRVALVAFTAAGCAGGSSPAPTGLSSFKVTMVRPTEGQLGTPAAPIDPSSLSIDVDAVDVHGQPWTANEQVDVYLSFAGTKIGRLTPCGTHEDEAPLTTITLVDGKARNQPIAIPRAYGVSALWLEQHPPKADTARSYATGTTRSIYFRNPTIPDLQTPLDPTAPTALYCSPFNGKHAVIDRATGHGILVVTSVFADAYVVADTGASYDPATGKGGFNHLYVFSFGRPPDPIRAGRILSSLEGNLSKFVGFSELNFPQQDYTATETVVPEPVTLTAADRPFSFAQRLKLLPLSGATVRATGRLCPIDPVGPDWAKYHQFVLDLGDPVGCAGADVSFSVTLPGKTLGTFDPIALARRPGGAAITITGMLKNLSGQKDARTPPVPCQANADCVAAGLNPTCVEATCKNDPYSLWSLVPRDASDVTVH